MEQRIIDLKNKYESKIYLNEDIKEIYKLDCQCPDFQFRRIKKIGISADIKLFYEPCKHLAQLVKTLLKVKYTLKEPKLEGTDKPIAELKRKLIERSGGICESFQCQKEAKKIHRKIRGSVGGKYSEENCVYICIECHKTLHSSEFSGSKSK